MRAASARGVIVIVNMNVIVSATWMKTWASQKLFEARLCRFNFYYVYAACRLHLAIRYLFGNLFDLCHKACQIWNENENVNAKRASAIEHNNEIKQQQR